MQSDIEFAIQELTSLDDYWEAGEHLCLLSEKRPDLARMYTLDILNRLRGDRYLRAFSFNILYRVDRAAAFDLIRKTARFCEPYVFSTMLNEVVNDVGVFDESPELGQIVQRLFKVITHRAGNAEDDHEKKAVGAFLEMYGHLAR